MAPHDSSNRVLGMVPADLYWGPEESMSYDDDRIEVASVAKKPQQQQHYRSIQDISMDLNDILVEMNADNDEHDDDVRNASMDLNDFQQSSSSSSCLRLDRGIGDISMDLSGILETLTVEDNDAFAQQTTTTAAAAPLNMDTKLNVDDLPSQGLFDMDHLDWGGFLENYHNKRNAAAHSPTAACLEPKPLSSESGADNGERKKVVRFQTQETVHNYYV